MTQLQNKTWARRAIWASSAGYFLCATGAVVVGLITSDDAAAGAWGSVAFPGTGAPLATHLFFLAVLSVPVVSVLVLFIGWRAYVADQYTTTIVAAVLPWVYLGALALW